MGRRTGSLDIYFEPMVFNFPYPFGNTGILILVSSATSSTFGD